jgi:hypothetical protein
MEMPHRYVYLMFQIDTNRLNSRQSLPYMNKLERWQENGVIDIEISEVAQKEARCGGNSLRSKKAIGYIFSETQATSDVDIPMRNQLKAILCPNGPKNQNEHNDVEIVFNAWKYGRILVTNDGASKNQPNGILGNREKLQSLGIRVMRDFEAVHLVEQKIEERDNLARLLAKETRQPLPTWIGKD